MIILTVIAFNDSPADGTLQANFDELGGSIGRADSNQLVLPDPERTISRVAAQVVYRNGTFAIVDRGSNPITINGRALGSGRETALAAGDRVRIGGYELSVKAGGAAAAAADAASTDPFSGLLGPSAASSPSPGGRLLDPLAMAGPGSSAPVASRHAAPAPASPAAAVGIPTDWDPFAPESVHISKSAAPRRDALGLDVGAAAPSALIPEFGGRGADSSSLDQLFGLDRASGADPLANSVLDAPMAKPNMAADVDPLRSLNSAPKASASSEADNLSDLQRPFIPPTMIKSATPAPPAAPVSGAVLSWDGDDSPSNTVIRARAARQMPPVAGAEVASPAAAGLGAGQLPAMVDVPMSAPAARAPAPAAPAVPRPPGPAAASDRALLEAFRRGLNAPALDLPALTPELMETVGQLLHEAARGTVDLLTVRATFKRELRAQATTIIPRNNNPLKFSPSAEVALQHMLSPPTRGFMPAVPAMHDAYDDLRAHQFGFIAGMQAALEGVLQRFDPAALEGQLTEQSLLRSLLPGSRRARLWEVFTEHYARIKADASDDFHNLFGKAFLQAYEEQISRLQAKDEKR